MDDFPKTQPPQFRGAAGSRSGGARASEGAPAQSQSSLSAMEAGDVEIIHWDVVKGNLGANTANNHLLLGNGFNMALGIPTSYKCIFNAMKQENSSYKKAKEDVKLVHHDIEDYIGKLTDSIDKIPADVRADRKAFIDDATTEQVVKADFFSALYGIVRPYQTKVAGDWGDGLKEFLGNFSHLFTLNYDPLLYQLLMQYRDDNDKGPRSAGVAAAVIELEEIVEDLYENGIWVTERSGEQVSTPLKEVRTKGWFMDNCVHLVSERSSEQYRQADIREAASIVWDRKKRIARQERELGKVPAILFDDGIAGLVMPHGGHMVDARSVPDARKLYHLHGAFYILASSTGEPKRVPGSAAALLEKEIAEAIQKRWRQILCVLAESSEEKLHQIRSNALLSKYLDALGDVKENIVIYGVSLSDKDKHIFDQINASRITKVYIAAEVGECGCPKDPAFIAHAMKKFKGKEVAFFNRDSVPFSEREQKKRIAASHPKPKDG